MMGKSNFSFLLDGHDPVFHKLALGGERAFSAAPNTTVLKCRQLAEAFAQHAAAACAVDTSFADLVRANAPSFGKRTPFTREYLQPFVDAYGDDASGAGKRKDEGEAGRFRRFTREEIAKRNGNLDIAWLKDENATKTDVAARIREELAAALDDIDELTMLLGGAESEAAA